MNWQVIFNPFSKFSEKQLFIFGLFSLMLNFVVCFYTKIEMDSIFHFSSNENLTLKSSFLKVTISCISGIIFLFLLAIIINKKSRFIDVVNTVLLSQSPNFLILLFIKFSGMNELSKNLKSSSGSINSLSVSTNDMLLLLFTILILLPIMIYGFVLIYNGFKTTTNFKKWQHIVIFIVSLFIFILFHQIYIQHLEL